MNQTSNLKPIYISSSDHRLLSKVINELIRSGGRVPASVENLRAEINRAVKLSDDAISPKTVVLNSGAELRDLQTGETEKWILVMPEYADPEHNRISVFAPVGTAILGYSEGDEIEWETPRGIRKLRIENVQHGAFKVPDLFQSLYGAR